VHPTPHVDVLGQWMGIGVVTVTRGETRSYIPEQGN
jgi:hypothetical protein